MTDQYILLRTDVKIVASWACQIEKRGQHSKSNVDNERDRSFNTTRPLMAWSERVQLAVIVTE